MDTMKQTLIDMHAKVKAMYSQEYVSIDYGYYPHYVEHPQFCIGIWFAGDAQFFRGATPEEALSNVPNPPTSEEKAQAKRDQAAKLIAEAEAIEKASA